MSKHHLQHSKLLKLKLAEQECPIKTIRSQARLATAAPCCCCVYLFLLPACQLTSLVVQGKRALPASAPIAFQLARYGA